MEASSPSSSSSQVPLSIESFSYSWLVNYNMRSSFEISCGNSFRTSLDNNEASFIEMDPTMPPSQRFYFTTTTTTSSHDFKFPALSPSPSFPLVHADRLISNGYLVPLQAYEGVAVSGAMIGSPDDINLAGEAPGKSGSLRKCCRRLSRQILEKYLNFLRPICRRIQRVGGSGGNYGINNIGIKLGGKKLLFHGGTTNTREAHHHNNHQTCFDEWRRSSCDSETSIYDAVLHCKNSIGK